MNEKFRSFYSNFIVHQAAGGDQRLIEAFTAIPREKFLSRGGWDVLTQSGYIKTPDGSPAFIYGDYVIALDKEKSINSGQPTLHAMCLQALDIKTGETVIHIGAGTGYYTAIIGYLVGNTGKVIAYEIESHLANLAHENLADMPWIQVISESAIGKCLPSPHVIYVNAGMTHPDFKWLKSLNQSGRIIFPLHPVKKRGGLLMLSPTHSEKIWKARFISQAIFIGCIGAESKAESDLLESSFINGELEEVASLHLNNTPDETAWHVGHGWWLSKKTVK